MSWYELYLVYLTVLHEFQAHLQQISIAKVLVSFVVFLMLTIVIDYVLFDRIYIIHELFSSSYLTVLISLTILGRYPNNSSSIRTLFITYVQAFQENDGAIYTIVFNIVLFIPLGIIITRYYNKSKITIIILFLAPLAIELCQLFTSRGVFEMSDIINNSIGGLLGFGITILILKTKYFFIQKITKCNSNRRENNQINS